MHRSHPKTHGIGLRRTHQHWIRRDGYNKSVVDIAAEIAGKKITKDHVDGPLGVRGRNSNNDLIREKLGWDYEMTLEEGMKKTYEWVRWQVSKQIYSVV